MKNGWICSEDAEQQQQRADKSRQALEALSGLGYLGAGTSKYAQCLEQE